MAISSTDNLRYPLVMQGETFTRRNICVFFIAMSTNESNTHFVFGLFGVYSVCLFEIWWGKQGHVIVTAPLFLRVLNMVHAWNRQPLQGFCFLFEKQSSIFDGICMTLRSPMRFIDLRKFSLRQSHLRHPTDAFFNWRLYWDDVRRFGCSFRSLCCPNGQSTFPQPNLRDCWTIHRKTVQTAQKIIPKSASSSITATSLCSNTDWAPDAVLILKRYSHGCSRSKDGDENLTVFHVVFSRVCSGVQCAFAFCEYAMPLLTGPKTIMEIYSNLITCAYQSEHICQYWACIATGLQTYGRNAPVMPA
jgi:hypothetical protein